MIRGKKINFFIGYLNEDVFKITQAQYNKCKELNIKVREDYGNKM